MKGTLAKFLDEPLKAELLEHTQAQYGQTLFFQFGSRIESVALL
jgi:hypothetical protein